MQKEKSIGAKDILAIVVKRKWLIVVPMIIVIGLVYTTTHFLEPQYQSSTIIWIDQPANVSRELATILGWERDPRESGEDRRRRIQALRNELTSQTYLFQVIRDLGLDTDLDITRQAARMREETPSYSLEQLKYNLLVDQLRNQISVDFVGKDQIQVTAQSGDPVVARDLVSKLTEILELEKTRYELETILDNQSFADLQLQKTEFLYKQTIDSLTSAQARLTTLQLPENISSETNRRDILSDLDKVQLEVDDFTDEREQLQRQLRDLNLSALRLKYTDSIVELRTEIDGQVARIASMMEKYAWNEQNIINMNIRLNDNLRLLEQTIGREVDRQFASYPENQRILLERYLIVEEQIDVLRSQKKQLQQSLANIDERVNQLPRLQAEISELERKVVDARRYRDAFQSEETTVEILSERAKERTKYRIIEPPRVPVEPFWPDIRKLMMLGFVLGAMLGGVAAFVAELFDNSIKRIEDIEDDLGLPVLATIPKIERLRTIRR